MSEYQKKKKTMEKGQVPVFIFNEGIVEKRLVKIRDIRGNEFEVIDGLHVGDVLITAGVPFINEGQKVKLWEPTYNTPASIQR